MKKILILFMMLGFSLTMVSCDNGNDDNKYSSDIIGTWACYKEFSSSQGWEELDGNDFHSLTFEKDGSGIEMDFITDRYGEYELDEIYYFEWDIKGDKLSIDFDYGNSAVVKIISITDEELVFEWEDEGETYKSYYFRID